MQQLRIDNKSTAFGRYFPQKYKKTNSYRLFSYFMVKWKMRNAINDTLELLFEEAFPRGYLRKKGRSHRKDAGWPRNILCEVS